MVKLPEGREPLLWKDIPFSERPKAHPSTERLEIEKLQERVAELEKALRECEKSMDVMGGYDGRFTLRKVVRAALKLTLKP